MSNQNSLTALLFIILLAFMSGVLVSNKYSDYLPSVRRLAVENNCGGYSHNDGKFAWELHKTPTEAIAITLPDVQSIEAPKPTHKPKVK